MVLVGIADRGYIFAQRLQKILKDIAPDKEIELIKVTIQKNKRSLEATTDIPVESAANKAIVIIDDVLNSGRTLAYGLGAFINVPLKKMRTAVLVDRSHHQFPIFSDFYGLKLSTILKEHVEVCLEEFDKQEDSVWLS
ncbi:phosphoribosyltransferase family protein [Sphingobacterium sp. T2]|uniref:phosphoribosyltransferase family protein n=1 Tax=Sphingobacterium sp. T2 TaxID=1590596 RepID=UPI002934EF04|nr:phosphoribosyltransferase family protein [Sphingobacterium sp. T2]